MVVNVNDREIGNGPVVFGASFLYSTAATLSALSLDETACGTLPIKHIVQGKGESNYYVLILIRLVSNLC